MSDEKKKYDTITMTDQDDIYRGMLEELSEWIYEHNPYVFQQSFLRKFNLKTKRGEVMKLAIDTLYLQMQTWKNEKGII